MRITIRNFVGPAAALLALACGGSQSRDRAVAGDLQRDLDLALSAGLELAPSSRSNGVVSAIERSPSRAPRSEPRPKATRPEREQPPLPVSAPVIDRQPSGDVAEVVQPATAAPAPANLPSPSSQPVAIGEGDHGSGASGVGIADQSGHGGIGPDVGSVIGGIMGVVLRGGGVGGEDKCEIHPNGGRMPRGGGMIPRGGGMIIDRRMPQGAGRPIYPGAAGARIAAR